MFKASTAVYLRGININFVPVARFASPAFVTRCYLLGLTWQELKLICISRKVECYVLDPSKNVNLALALGHSEQ